jgi:hypothetical protein
MKIISAKGIYSWFLFKFNYSAITMPWQTVHVRSDRIGPEYRKLIDHEMVHIDQINKYGSIRWTLLYLYYSMRYGYINNPLEIEARNSSGW